MHPQYIVSLVFWGLLLAIGVSDAQRHRIPNQMVVALLMVTLLHIVVFEQSTWLDHLAAGLISFSVCLGLYVLRIMAGGDVKLLFVIGLWLGVDQLAGGLIAIILAGGVVGCFYLMLHLAQSSVSFLHNTRGYYLEKASFGLRKQTKLVIPFAPVVVIGLASFYYIQ